MASRTVASFPPLAALGVGLFDAYNDRLSFKAYIFSFNASLWPQPPQWEQQENLRNSVPVLFTANTQLLHSL